MSELLTSAQMRAVEQAAISSGAVTGLELMERAGRGVVEALFGTWPEFRQTAHRVAVLCGPGNNGGDGFVIARLLKQWGWQVEVFLYGDPKTLPPDAKANHDRWAALGPVRDLASFIDGTFSGFDVFIDALFGTGLTRPLEADAVSALGLLAIRRDGPSPARVVAVDIPSGICADSGRALYVEDSATEQVVQRLPGADLTVTFERPKRGHALSEGLFLSGKIRTVSLGIRHDIDGPLNNNRSEIARTTDPMAWRLSKTHHGHKYDHGHALILSGPSGKGGAARLAARGALRIGAGLVSVGCPPDALVENAARLDAVMLRPVADAAALTAALQDRRITTLLLGPGMGLDRARDLVPVALRSTRACVLDADALTAFADDPSTLFELLHDNCVLTPHGGEFARLFPDLARKLNARPTKGPAYSKVDATQEAAARAGCVVLYKGPDTVIAGPSGQCAINSADHDRSAPWLATAGSGDVLSGFVTGLLARGGDPFVAASAGAWLHVECARHFGPGLISEDLPEQLPAVLRKLGA